MAGRGGFEPHIAKINIQRRALKYGLKRILHKIKI